MKVTFNIKTGSATDVPAADTAATAAAAEVDVIVPQAFFASLVCAVTKEVKKELSLAAPAAGKDLFDEAKIRVPVDDEKNHWHNGTTTTTTTTTVDDDDAVMSPLLNRFGKGKIVESSEDDESTVVDGVEDGSQNLLDSSVEDDDIAELVAATIQVDYNNNVDEFEQVNNKIKQWQWQWQWQWQR